MHSWIAIRLSPRIFPGDTYVAELVRAIARTVSKLFYIPWREPCAHNRYGLREIVEDLRRDIRKPILNILKARILL